VLQFQEADDFYTDRAPYSSLSVDRGRQPHVFQHLVILQKLSATRGQFG
jgi:hypothetical protein